MKNTCAFVFQTSLREKDVAGRSPPRSPSPRRRVRERRVAQVGETFVRRFASRHDCSRIAIHSAARPLMSATKASLNVPSRVKSRMCRMGTSQGGDGRTVARGLVLFRLEPRQHHSPASVPICRTPAAAVERVIFVSRAVAHPPRGAPRRPRDPARW